jgi:hypothetical protein
VKTPRSRQIVLGLAAFVAAAVVLNVVGLLRYPGGPLRDPSDDGPLLLDIRPADQGSNTVGNSLPSDWAIAGRSYDYGVLTIHNPTPFTATVEAVTPLDPTAGLTLVAVYIRRTGVASMATFALSPSGQYLDPATLNRDFVLLPAAVEPSGDTHEQDAEVVVVVRADRAGAFGFSGLALNYRIGPFTFHAIQHLALVGCLGPLPGGVICPSNE